MRKTAVCLVILAGLLLSAMAGATAAKAHHRACDPPFPAQWSFPRKVKIHPDVQNYAAWQIAMRDINLADTRVQWIAEVPWSSSTYDVAVYPADLSTEMDVVMGCSRPWAYRSNSSSIRVDPDTAPGFVGLWAGHELMHGVFFFADHIHWPEEHPEWWTNPAYCDGPYAVTGYVGGMSYCYGWAHLFYYDYPDYPNIIDDFDMLREWYP